MIIKNIKDPFYHRKIFLVFDCPKDELSKYLKLKYPEVLDANLPTYCEGHYFLVQNEEKAIQDYYIWVDKFDWTIPSLSLISHETLHLVFASLKNTGIKYCDESEECFTYYFDHILEEVLNVFRQVEIRGMK